MAGWAKQAGDELRASGETIRHSRQDALPDLTPQERQIAILASQGLANRDIGERLFLSPRTIGSHLYRIFPKLGITSRAQLASALQRSAHPGTDEQSEVGPVQSTD